MRGEQDCYVALRSQYEACHFVNLHFSCSPRVSLVSSLLSRLLLRINCVFYAENKPLESMPLV